MARAAFHHIGVDGVSGEAERGQAVGQKVNPEQVDRQQRRRQPDDHADGHQEQLTTVPREQILQRLADVVVDAAAFFDGGDDGRKVVVGDDHVRRLLRHFGSGAAHRDADVGAFDGGRVVHAVAGHRDDRAIRFPRANDAQFMFGSDARVNGGFGRALPQFVVGHLVQLDTSDGHVLARGDAEFTRYRGGGVRMVAGNHHHADAGRAAFGDGFLRFSAGRVIHAGQADEHQVMFDFLSSEFGGRTFVQVTISRTEHAQSLLRHRAVLRGDALPVVRRHGAHFRTRENLRAAREEHVGCAVDEGAQPAVGHPANDRAALAVGVEWDFVMLRQLLFDAFLVAARFVSAGEQRSLCGVTNDAPDSVFERQMGVVASNQDIRQL